jgi:hypothetical protein
MDIAKEKRQRGFHALFTCFIPDMYSLKSQ